MNYITLEFLYKKFNEEKEKWLKKILFEIYDMHVDGPEKEQFLKEDDLILKEEKLYIKMLYMDTIVASLSFSIRGTNILSMEMKKDNLKNILKTKEASELQSWKIYSFGELSHA